jgi:hypothetical protein
MQIGATLFALLRAIAKVCLHALTGQCELERVTRPFPEGRLEMIAKVRASFAQSKRLVLARRAVCTLEPLVVADVQEEVRCVKHFANPGLAFCLQSLRRTTVALTEVARLGKEPYSSADARHESLLEDLWRALCPGQLRRGGRISEDWQLVGFQGTDPQTDFRGGGVLSLENLVFFARQGETAERIMREQCADVTRGGFPFAVAGINLTWFLLDLLQRRRLDDLFLFPATTPPPAHVNERSFLLAGEEIADDDTTRSLALERFSTVYSALFRLFARRWREARPRDAMAFPAVFAKFRREVAGLLDTRAGLDWMSGRTMHDGLDYA